MGICCHKKQYIPMPENQHPDLSFYISEPTPNQYRYLFVLSTYAQAQQALKNIIAKKTSKQQARPILTQHLKDIESFLSQFTLSKALLPRRIEHYASKFNRVLFFELTSIVMKKTKHSTGMPLTLKVDGNTNGHSQNITINEFIWQAKDLFLEWNQWKVDGCIRITIGTYDVTINCEDLGKYLFPVCQSANIRKAGSMGVDGQLFFRAQCINNVRQYKRQVVQHVNQRMEFIRHYLDAEKCQELEPSSLPHGDFFNHTEGLD